jgi:Uma2 family endonuclease
MKKDKFIKPGDDKIVSDILPGFRLNIDEVFGVIKPVYA